ncbi:MAG: ABC transporter permease subunit [Planctomycetota bacterium]|nr:ABC transporter permease subunit [Planctomycetota bacterium]
MFGLLFTIARNTFRESVRQPVVLIINGVAVFLLILANPLSAYTLEDDQRMLLDIGLATIFAAGSILAAFVASDAISREIDDKTVLTVVSKPVPRPVLVVGKFLGILGVLLMSVLLQSFVFMLAEYHTVLQTVRDPIHLPVLFLGGGAIVVGLAVATWMNYFYGRNFPASAMLAIVVLTAIAVAASTRTRQAATLTITIGLFLGGLLSDHFLGRPLNAIEDRWRERAMARGEAEEVPIFRSFIQSDGSTITSQVEERVIQLKEGNQLSDFAEGQEGLKHRSLRTVRAIVPNFQILWLADALTQDRKIPRDYAARAAAYAACLTIGILGLAVALFDRREVG